jgi:hypothetical protein
VEKRWMLFAKTGLSDWRFWFTTKLTTALQNFAFRRNPTPVILVAFLEVSSSSIHFLPLPLEVAKATQKPNCSCRRHGREMTVTPSAPIYARKRCLDMRGHDQESRRVSGS